MTTEQVSKYNDLDKMSTNEILSSINREDREVPLAISKVIPQIEVLVNKIVERLRKGGRVIYIGAGTSGRIGILDASEIPPTYGVKDKFLAIIAGGDKAIRNAVENAEDNFEQGWEDIKQLNLCINDIILGLAASGKTPYVIGAVKKAKEKGLLTACITCNTGTELSRAVDIAIELIVGPEFVSGSTRMKAGTAQKLVLNMISTSTMILLGHVKGNKMWDMQLSNKKLIERGIRMIIEETDIQDYDFAKKILLEYGSVRTAIDNYKAKR